MGATMRITKRLMGGLLAAGLAGAGVATALASEPQAVVEKLHATLLDVMKAGDSLDYEVRFERVAPAVDASFDVAFMAEKSLGRHWKKLAPNAQASWVALFRRFMVSNYAGRFDRYSGQSFEEHGVEPGTHETMLVQTVLRNPEDEDVELNYRLREIDAGWRVVDIYLKGTVSELALRRADYSAVMKRDGYEALATYLTAKIDALAAGTAE